MISQGERNMKKALRNVGLFCATLLLVSACGSNTQPTAARPATNPQTGYTGQPGYNGQPGGTINTGGGMNCSSYPNGQYMDANSGAYVTVYNGQCYYQ